MKIESAAAYRYINKTYAATVNTAPAMEALVRSEPMKTDKLHISGEAPGFAGADPESGIFCSF